MRGQSMLIAAFAFALIIAVFAVINVEQVQVNFLFAKTSTPLILVILASTFLGGLSAGSFGLVREFKLRRTVKQLEKQIAELTSAEGGSEESKRRIALSLTQSDTSEEPIASFGEESRFAHADDAGTKDISKDEGKSDK